MINNKAKEVALVDRELDAGELVKLVGKLDRWISSNVLLIKLQYKTQARPFVTTILSNLE